MPNIPDSAQIANTTGAFQGTVQTPQRADQSTLLPVPPSGVVTSVAAANDTVTIGGTASAPTVKTNLPVVAGTMPADVPFTALTTLLTTASIEVGTWLVNASFALESSNSTTFNSELHARVGTATAALTGQITAIGNGPVAGAAAVIEASQTTLTFVAVVTVAGTLIFEAQSDAGDAWTAKAASGTHFVGATASGFTAVKIA